MTEITHFGLAINGFFTGVGIIFANIFGDEYIKPKIKKFKEHVAKAKEEFKNNKGGVDVK